MSFLATFRWAIIQATGTAAQPLNRYLCDSPYLHGIGTWRGRGGRVGWSVGLDWRPDGPGRVRIPLRKNFSLRNFVFGNSVYPALSFGGDTKTHTHRRLHSGSMRRWRPSVTKLTPSFMAGSWVIQIDTRFGSFSCIKKMLGRAETRTRDRMYCQMIRTVKDNFRDDRAIIVTCSLRTPTDRLKENYSID